MHRTSSWQLVQYQDWQGYLSELETVVSASPDSVGTFIADSRTADRAVEVARTSAPLVQSPDRTTV